jgi:hypothetical protein
LHNYAGHRDNLLLGFYGARLFFGRASPNSFLSRLFCIAWALFFVMAFPRLFVAPSMVVGPYRFPIVGKKPWDGHPRKMGNRPIAAKPT